jgi:hypothetical protein
MQSTCALVYCHLWPVWLYHTSTLFHKWHTFGKNLTEIRFTNEEMRPLNLGFQYSIEKPPAAYFTNPVIETNNTIKLLDAKMHNTRESH